jgi:hypothetical protein
MGAAACGEGDGTLRATDDSSGGLVLLPSFRFARPHSELNGRRIFITSGGDLVCEHGELPSTISTWLQREKAAERSGHSPPPRASICDCRTSKGLNSAGSPGQAAKPPKSLFDHLCSLEMPTITVHGREARQVPFTHGNQTTFLTTMGDLVCRHGRKRQTLGNKRWKEGAVSKGIACSCAPPPFPFRKSLVGVRLGRYGGQYGKTACPPVGR